VEDAIVLLSLHVCEISFSCSSWKEEEKRIDVRGNGMGLLHWINFLWIKDF
jgi:hypothetical protein